MAAAKECPAPRRAHEISEECWCRPRVEKSWHGRVVAHNLDGEKDSREEDKKSC